MPNCTLSRFSEADERKKLKETWPYNICNCSQKLDFQRTGSQSTCCLNGTEKKTALHEAELFQITFINNKPSFWTVLVKEDICRLLYWSARFSFHRRVNVNKINFYFAEEGQQFLFSRNVKAQIVLKDKICVRSSEICHGQKTSWMSKGHSKTLLNCWVQLCLHSCRGRGFVNTQVQATIISYSNETAWVELSPLNADKLRKNKYKVHQTHKFQQHTEFYKIAGSQISVFPFAEAMNEGQGHSRLALTCTVQEYLPSYKVWTKSFLFSLSNFCCCFWMQSVKQLFPLSL